MQKKSNMVESNVLADRSGVVQIQGAFPASESFVEAPVNPYGRGGLDACLPLTLDQHSLGQQFPPVVRVRSDLLPRRSRPRGEKN